MGEGVLRAREIARRRLRGLPIPDALTAPTPQQAECVRLRMRGMSNQEIAATLWISGKTVESHMRNVRLAASAGTPTSIGPIDMVVYALMHDLVPVDCPLGEALNAYVQRKR